MLGRTGSSRASASVDARAHVTSRRAAGGGGPCVAWTLITSDQRRWPSGPVTVTGGAWCRRTTITEYLDTAIHSYRYRYTQIQIQIHTGSVTVTGGAWYRRTTLAEYLNTELYTVTDTDIHRYRYTQLSMHKDTDKHSIQYRQLRIHTVKNIQLHIHITHKYATEAKTRLYMTWLRRTSATVKCHIKTNSILPQIIPSR